MSNENGLERMIVCDYNYHAIQGAIRFLANHHSTHLMIDSESGNGDGMTLLMSEIRNIIKQRRYSFIHLDAACLLINARTNSDFLRKINKNHYLLIDDINFLLDKSDDEISPIFDMLKSRTTPDKKTIFTCAIAAGELKAHMKYDKLSYLYSSTTVRLASPSLDDKNVLANEIMGALKIKHSKQIRDIIVESDNIRELINKLMQYQANINISDADT